MTRLEAIARLTQELKSGYLTINTSAAKKAKLERYSAMTDAEYTAYMQSVMGGTVARMAQQLKAGRI